MKQFERVEKLKKSQKSSGFKDRREDNDFVVQQDSCFNRYCLECVLFKSATTMLLELAFLIENLDGAAWNCSI